VVLFSGVATGEVAGTAIYNSVKRTWSAGPNLPTVDGQNYDLADAPAAWLKTDKVMFAASPGSYQTPTHFFQFGTVNTGRGDTRRGSRSRGRRSRPGRRRDT